MTSREELLDNLVDATMALHECISSLDSLEYFKEDIGTSLYFDFEGMMADAKETLAACEAIPEVKETIDQVSQEVMEQLGMDGTVN